MKYEIAIYEKRIHKVDVESESSEKALAFAYELLTNAPAEILKFVNYRYDGEYLGVHEVLEIKENA
jgi:hypothetical protein